MRHRAGDRLGRHRARAPRPCAASWCRRSTSPASATWRSDRRDGSSATSPRASAPTTSTSRRCRAGDVQSGRNGNTLWAAAGRTETVRNRPVLIVTVLTRQQERFFGPTFRWFLVSAGASLALGAVVSIFLGRRLGRPVLAAATTTSRIATGDLVTRLPVPPPAADDELANLARSINSMADGLGRATRPGAPLPAVGLPRPPDTDDVDPRLRGGDRRRRRRRPGPRRRGDHRRDPPARAVDRRPVGSRPTRRPPVHARPPTDGRGRGDRRRGRGLRPRAAPTRASTCTRTSSVPDRSWPTSTSTASRRSSPTSRPTRSPTPAPRCGPPRGPRAALAVIEISDDGPGIEADALAPRVRSALPGRQPAAVDGRRGRGSASRSWPSSPR